MKETHSHSEEAAQKEWRRILYGLSAGIPAVVLLTGIAGQSPEVAAVGFGLEIAMLLKIGLSEHLRVHPSATTPRQDQTHQ